MDELSGAVHVLAAGCANDTDRVYGRVIREMSWCFKGGCTECLDYSRNLVGRTAPALSIFVEVSKDLEEVAESYKRIESQTIVPIVDSLREAMSTLELYHRVCQVNHAAVAKYQELVSNDGSMDRVKRTEVIIGATKAEMEHYHEEKQRLWGVAIESMIDGLLEKHQDIVRALKRAKQTLRKDVV